MKLQENTAESAWLKSNPSPESTKQISNWFLEEDDEFTGQRSMYLNPVEQLRDEDEEQEELHHTVMRSTWIRISQDCFQHLGESTESMAEMINGRN